MLFVLSLSVYFFFRKSIHVAWKVFLCSGYSCWINYSIHAQPAKPERQGSRDRADALYSVSLIALIQWAVRKDKTELGLDC